MIYFTSDQHFFCRRGPAAKIGGQAFASVEERDAFLLARWNETVAPADTVYILGDFSEGAGGETNAVLRALHGRKYLIAGNHDPYLEDPAFEAGLLGWHRLYYELLTLGTKFVLFHYPIEIWSGYDKDRVHLHGHMHYPRAMYEPIRRYEVGVDAHEGRPVALEEIWRTVQPYHNLNRLPEGIKAGREQAAKQREETDES